MNDTVDLNSLSKDELKAQAEILGVTLKGNPTAETIRDKLREALGQPKPKDQLPVGREIAIQKGERRYTVEIHKDGKDKQPVFLGCNGRSVRIKRGEQVTIGDGLFQSLKNAIENRFDTESEEWIRVPSYPYTVLNIEDPTPEPETQE